MRWPIRRTGARRAALGLTMSLACMLNSVAASFDCDKARSKSERLICGDPQLSAMDEQLAALASAGKKRSASPRQYQRALDNAWLLRQQCQDIACVERWYRQRLAVLATPAPVTDAPPAKAAPAPAAIPAPPKPVVPVLVPALVAPVKAPVRPAPPNAMARASTVPKATPVKPARELENVSPGAQLQVIGAELGFDIPLTRDEFLDRYGATGGECGASKSLAGLKTQSKSAASDCWSGRACPAPAEALACKLVRTAYDGEGRLVLFSATLNATEDDAGGIRELRKIVRKFAEMAHAEARSKNRAGAGELMSASGSLGDVQLSAEVMPGEPRQHSGVFSLAME